MRCATATLCGLLLAAAGDPAAAEPPSNEVIIAALRDNYSSWESVRVEGTRTDFHKRTHPKIPDGRRTDPDVPYGWSWRSDGERFSYTSAPKPTMDGKGGLRRWNVFDGEYLWNRPLPVQGGLGTGLRYVRYKRGPDHVDVATYRSTPRPSVAVGHDLLYDWERSLADLWEATPPRYEGTEIVEDAACQKFVFEPLWSGAYDRAVGELSVWIDPAEMLLPRRLEFSMDNDVLSKVYTVSRFMSAPDLRLGIDRRLPQSYTIDGPTAKLTIAVGSASFGIGQESDEFEPVLDAGDVVDTQDFKGRLSLALVGSDGVLRRQKDRRISEARKAVHRLNPIPNPPEQNAAPMFNPNSRGVDASRPKGLGLSWVMLAAATVAAAAGGLTYLRRG